MYTSVRRDAQNQKGRKANGSRGLNAEIRRFIYIRCPPRRAGCARCFSRWVNPIYIYI